MLWQRQRIPEKNRAEQQAIRWGDTGTERKLVCTAKEGRGYWRSKCKLARGRRASLQQIYAVAKAADPKDV